MAAYAAPQGCQNYPCVSNGMYQMRGSDNGETVCEPQGYPLNRDQCQAIGCCQFDEENNSCYSAVGQNQCFGTNHIHLGNTHIHTYTYNTQTNEQTRIGEQHIGSTNVKVNLNLKNLKFNFGL